MECSSLGGNMKFRGFNMFLVLILPLLAVSAYADTVVLGSAASFAVLGASAVTNTNATTLNGDLGVSAGTSITGLSSITVSGTTNIANGVAGNAQTDLTAAISGLSTLSPFSLSSSSFTAGNITLTPGVYSTGSTFLLTGGDTLTLDAGGKNNVSFVFLVGSALTTGVGSTVKLINPGLNDGVYWVEQGTGGSATLDTGSTFVGNILATVSITMGQGVTITCGSALANTGAVTMNNDTISTGCGSSLDISDEGEVKKVKGGKIPGPGTPPVSNTPESGTLLLVGCGMFSIVLLRRHLPTLQRFGSARSL